MDYSQVDQIINSHGFADEPAFKDVYIQVAPIPDMNGCPLGLYYPGSELIVIPPDGYESVLLHELGHRYGHYHYDNLSEDYAERFREKYQKGRSILYAGGDFGRLPKMGSLFQEGQKGELQLAFDRPLSYHDLSYLNQMLYDESQGEPIPQVYYTEDPSVIGLKFTRGVDWLAIAAGALAALTIAGVGAMGYAIYKTARDTPWVVPLTFFGSIAGAILLFGYATHKYGPAKARS